MLNHYVIEGKISRGLIWKVKKVHINLENSTSTVEKNISFALKVKKL